MPKKESEEVIRVHLWLYKFDWEKMKTIYEPTIGPSKAIREIVQEFPPYDRGQGRGRWA